MRNLERKMFRFCLIDVIICFLYTNWLHMLKKTWRLSRYLMPSSQGAYPRHLLKYAVEIRWIFQKDIYVANWCTEVSWKAIQPHSEGKACVVFYTFLSRLPASEPQCNGQADWICHALGSYGQDPSGQLPVTNGCSLDVRACKMDALGTSLDWLPSFPF